MDGDASREPRFALKAGFAILRHTWDRETVVYHGGSGDTHLIGPTGRAVLDALELGPCALAELAERVAPVLAEEGVDEPRRELLRMLTDFESLGLVAPVDES